MRSHSAIAQYEKAIPVRPRYAEARFSWGNALKAMERHEEAIAQYEKAIAIRPGCRIKRAINLLLGSELMEEKRYPPCEI
jgi:tetratricopeptide (TPR) repeat protein